MAFYDINSIVIVCVFLCGLHKIPSCKEKEKKTEYYMLYVGRHHVEFVQLGESSLSHLTPENSTTKHLNIP